MRCGICRAGVAYRLARPAIQAESALSAVTTAGETHQARQG